jgi:hypothetical protein
MRSALAICCLTLIAFTAFPQQNNRGAVFGLISDREARLVASAPIELRNVTTGARFHADTGDRLKAV